MTAAAALPPLPDDARVSVVVPALAAAGVVERAIEAALAQGDLVAEVVVAAGDEATRDAAQRSEDARVRVIGNPSGRTPDALNAAIAASTHPVVVRVDAQSILPPGYVARAVATLRRTGAGNVGGLQVPTADAGFGRAVAAAMRSPVGSGGAAYRGGSEPGPADTVYLGVFRREALVAVGGYDPRFTRNQDAELNERLRRAGHTVWFDPELAVTYAPRSSPRSLASQYLQYGRWRRLTARVHPGSLRARQLAPPALVLAGTGVTVIAAVTRAWWLPAVGAGAYAAAVAAAVRAEAGDAPTTARATAAVAIMHAAWGIGFLVGPPRGVSGGPRPADG
ncbi:MAG: glycosyltransferase family 2 protein [Nitriliruptor sp.]